MLDPEQQRAKDEVIALLKAKPDAILKFEKKDAMEVIVDIATDDSDLAGNLLDVCVAEYGVTFADECQVVATKAITDLLGILMNLDKTPDSNE